MDGTPTSFHLLRQLRSGPLLSPCITGAFEVASVSARQRLGVGLLFLFHGGACECSEGKWESARQKERAGAE